jgi:WD40 repeat protein
MSNFSVVVRNSQTNSITQKLSYSSSSAMIPIEAVAFGSDEKTVVTSRRDQDQLDIWDIQTGQIINGIKFPTKINDHDHPVTNVAIAKNGNVIAVSTYKKVLVFESRTGKVLVDEEIISESGRVVDSLDFNDNGRFLIATSGEKKSVVFDLTAKKTISLIGHYGGKKSISFNSSGDRVLTSLSDGTVILWDTQTGQEIRRFNVSDSSYQRVAFVPDAEDFFIVVGPMEVSLWHVGSEQKIATLANHSLYSHRSIGFSPDGENLYFGGTHGEIFHWKRDRAEE